MAYEYENEPICPYCDKKQEYNWLDDDDQEELECEFCGKTFDLTIEIKKEYSTYKKNCIEQNKGHILVFDYKHILKRKFNTETKMWEKLPENEWKYYLHFFCKKCDEDVFKKVTKKEFEYYV